MADDVEEIEAEVRRSWDAGDFDAAATTLIREYGPQVLGFLVAQLRHEADAGEVFSMFCEDLWKGLPRFEWRCKARTWAYTLARHAAHRHGDAAVRKPGRNVPLSRAAGLSQIEADVRSRTLVFLRTETKDRMRVLCEQLPSDDQALIILRVDKGLSWRELAEVMAYDGSPPSGEELERATARYKKRFQLVKDKLRELARADGLVD